jgi:formylglycine-generating enzyme required for sulfatase activity
MTEPTSGMVLVEIPPGSFAMGSPTAESGRNVDELVHDVSLSASYYLGRSEVTQQEWRTVMGSAPSRFADCGPRCPVENVTFDDVQRFLAKLNAGPAKDVRYRLPTEAEWEYACRAGTASPFSSGAIVTTTQVNVDGRRPYDNAPVGSFRGRPTLAGSFEPNPWGLADMHGNVSEWTADWYAPYEATASRDPHGASSGTEHVVRGGSWETTAANARCAARSKRAPAERSSSLGFRLAADLASPSQP